MRAIGNSRRLQAILSARLSAADGAAYDDFVARARGGHYSQTRAYAQLATAAKRFTPLFFLAYNEGGAAVGAALILRATAFGLPLPFAGCERGPVCDRISCLAEIIAHVRALALRRGILRLSLMPYFADDQKPVVEGILREQGFADVQHFAGRHVRSLRLDLTRLDPADPFAGRALAKLRQNINRAKRAGATARIGGHADIPAFAQMQARLLQLENKRPPTEGWYAALGEYLGTDHERGAIFVCEKDGETVSAVVMLRHGPLMVYAMGASSEAGGRFPKMVLPLGAAMEWAIQNNIAQFDLGGIPMEGDDDAKRLGIAEFKHSFAGAEIHFVHEHASWF